MTNATVYLNELNGFIMWPLIQGFLPLFQPPVRWWEQGPWRCRWHSTPCLDPRSCSCLRCHDAIPWLFSLCRIAKSERVCPQKRNIFKGNRMQLLCHLVFQRPKNWCRKLIKHGSESPTGISMGKSSNQIRGIFQLAMFEYQRVCPRVQRALIVPRTPMPCRMLPGECRVA